METYRDHPTSQIGAIGGRSLFMDVIGITMMVAREPRYRPETETSGSKNSKATAIEISARWLSSKN